MKNSFGASKNLCLGFIVALSIMFVSPNLFSQTLDKFGLRHNDEGGLTLYDYSGDLSTVVIPAKYLDIAITEIAGGVFTGAFDGKNLTSVELPLSLKKIGHNSFINNKDLAQVTIGGNIELHGAFDNLFESAYNREGRQAGVYKKNGFAWILATPLTEPSPASSPTPPTARTSGSTSASPARTSGSTSASPARTSGTTSTPPARTSGTAAASPARTSGTAAASPARTSGTTSASPARTSGTATSGDRVAPGSPAATTVDLAAASASSGTTASSDTTSKPSTANSALPDASANLHMEYVEDRPPPSSDSNARSATSKSTPAASRTATPQASSPNATTATTRTATAPSTTATTSKNTNTAAPRSTTTVPRSTTTATRTTASKAPLAYNAARMSVAEAAINPARADAERMGTISVDMLYTDLANKEKDRTNAVHTPLVLADVKKNATDNTQQNDLAIMVPILINPDNLRLHRVLPKETLSSIARKYYGNENAFFFPLLILATNSITNPDKINIDQLILVPDLDANRANKETRNAIVEHFYRVSAYYAKRGDKELSDKIIWAAQKW